MSIDVRVGKSRSSETNAAGTGVINGVEALEERETVDEVQAQTAGPPQVMDDKVNAVRLPADQRVERARPYLRVWRELEFSATGREDKRLEGCILRPGDAKKTCLGIMDRMSRTLVSLECIYAGVIGL
jgi:hypothetical protein